MKTKALIILMAIAPVIVFAQLYKQPLLKQDIIYKLGPEILNTPNCYLEATDTGVNSIVQIETNAGEKILINGTTTKGPYDEVLAVGFKDGIYA
ncbi:MAG: hypothetical protein K8R67_02875, partial [Desulfobacteraceae bacterium]|nr:hypothetical protein [Desulfobacteraceae bacterium]